MAIMKDTVKNDSGQEVEVYIEFDPEEAIPENIYTDEVLRGPSIPDAHEAFKKAMELIHTCAEQVAHTIQKIPGKTRPTSCEVQLSIKLTAGVAIMVSTSSEAQLQITLKWDKQDQDGE